MKIGQLYFLTSGKNAEEVKKNLDSLITITETLPILIETGPNFFTVCGGDSNIQIEPLFDNIKEIKFGGGSDYKLTNFRYVGTEKGSTISFSYNTIGIIIKLENQEKILEEKISQLEEKISDLKES